MPKIRIFPVLAICVIVLNNNPIEAVGANDNLLLKWNVPTESQFLGFCGVDEKSNISLYVIAPEASKTLFSKERYDDESGLSSRSKKKYSLLKNHCGFTVTYMSPDCVVDRSPYGFESLSLASESVSGEISAFLGFPFLRDCVLKYQPITREAQLRRSSIETRRPVRSYSGRLSAGHGLVLDGIKFQGVNTECRLSFCSDIDLIFGDEIRRSLEPNDLGQVVVRGSLTNSNPMVRVPVEKKFTYVKKLDLDGMEIEQLCCLPESECVGIKIGWGLLQDVDFELEFTGTELELRVYDTPLVRDKILRTGELKCDMTDEGLYVSEIADWSVLSKILQKEDVISRAGDQTYPGELSSNAQVCLLMQRLTGGVIEVLRNGEKITISVPKNAVSFKERDSFLFKSETK